jgi:tetratricopeptide (TPR) repeat protein
VESEDIIAGAIRTAVSRHEALPQAMRLIEAWSVYFSDSEWRYYLSFQMRTLQLEGARMLGDRAAELAALTALARTSGYLGRPDKATSYNQEALAFARELGAQAQIIRLLSVLGRDSARRGQRAEAEGMYAEATAIARNHNEELTDFSALNNLGRLAGSIDHLDQAEQWYRRALEYALATGNPDAGFAVHNLGFVYDEQGDVAAAQAVFEAMVAIQRAIDPSVTGGGVALNMLGQLALKAGDLESASGDFTDALSTFEHGGMADNVSQVRGNLALLAGLQAQRQGDREAAEQALEEALRWFEQTGGNANATDQRPYVRHLLAALREPAAASSTPASSVPAEVSAARIEYVRQLLAVIQGQMEASAFSSENAPPAAGAPSHAAEPEAVPPVATAPVVAEPVSVEPATPEPDTAEPVAVQPVGVEPVAASTPLTRTRRRWWPWGRG